MEGWAKSVVQHLAARGAEATRLRRAAALWEREGGALLSHLIAAGCEPVLALESVALVSGVPAATPPELSASTRLPPGFAPDVLWQVLAVPLGTDDPPLLAYADPGDVAAATHLGLPPHRVCLTFERHIRELLETLVGPPPDRDTLSPRRDAAEAATIVDPGATIVDVEAAQRRALADVAPLRAASVPSEPPTESGAVVTGRALEPVAGSRPATDPNAPLTLAPQAVTFSGGEDREPPVLRLDDYELGAALGEGGMAIVHGAVDKKTGQRVAVKLLHNHLAKEGDFIERFVREGRSAARLNHPNLLKVYGVGRSDGRHFMVSEIVEGGSASELIRSIGIAPAPLAATIISEMLSGLAYAHAAGVIHRDLKPANLLFHLDGTLKIADFGIAKDAGDATLTQTGSLLGTPAYMSPEQASGEKHLDGRSDLFSTGIVLYELLTGRNPFHDERISASLLRIGRAEYPHIAGACPGVPGTVEALVGAMLVRDREARLQDAKTGMEMVAPLVRWTEENEPGLIRRALMDPDATRSAALRRHAMLEFRRGARLIEQGPAKRSAGALAIYRATMIDPTLAEATDMLAQLCRVGDLNFGPPRSPAIGETEAVLEREGEKVGLLRRLAELHRADGNIFKAQLYLKRYLAHRPQDNHAMTQLSALVGEDSDAPLAPGSTTTIFPAGGTGQPAAPTNWQKPGQLEEVVAPAPAILGIIDIEGDAAPVGAFEWVGALARALGGKVALLAGVVVLFVGGLWLVGAFIDRAQEDIDHGFDGAEQRIEARASAIAGPPQQRLAVKLGEQAAQAGRGGQVANALLLYDQAANTAMTNELKARMRLQRARLLHRSGKRADARAEVARAVELAPPGTTRREALSEQRRFDAE